jgi:hypothetical protein
MLCMATKGFLFCLTLSYERTALCKARHSLSDFVQPACTAYLHTSRCSNLELRINHRSEQVSKCFIIAFTTNRITFDILLGMIHFKTFIHTQGQFTI